MVNGGGGGRGGRARAARFDDGTAALTHGRNEVIVVPGVVHQFFGLFAVDRAGADVRVHRIGVIAPDRHLVHRSNGLAGLFRKLRKSTVVVKAHEGGEALRIQVGGRLHRDVSIRVAGVADDEHLDVAGGRFVEGLSLHGEDLAVGRKKFAAIHPFRAGTGADEEHGFGVAKGFDGVIGRLHFREQRESAVREFHHDALQALVTFRSRTFQKRQRDGLIRSEKVTRSNAEENRITDLAGRAGHGNADGFLHF